MIIHFYFADVPPQLTPDQYSALYYFLKAGVGGKKEGFWKGMTTYLLLHIVSEDGRTIYTDMFDSKRGGNRQPTHCEYKLLNTVDSIKTQIEEKCAAGKVEVRIFQSYSPCSELSEYQCTDKHLELRVALRSKLCQPLQIYFAQLYKTYNEVNNKGLRKLRDREVQIRVLKNWKQFYEAVMTWIHPDNASETETNSQASGSATDSNASETETNSEAESEDGYLQRLIDMMKESKKQHKLSGLPGEKPWENFLQKKKNHIKDQEKELTKILGTN